MCKIGSKSFKSYFSSFFIFKLIPFLRLHVCSVKNITGFGDISSKFGMVWRFLPMADPFVDVMISRDLDSR
jgi:hypothetical protein